MGEPKFPPPDGQLGYRDAAITPDPSAPSPPVPDGPELPRGKRVVASRPDDPDVALAKAFYPGKPRVAKVSYVGIVVTLLLVLAYIALQVASSSPPRRRPAPACVGTHC